MMRLEVDGLTFTFSAGWSADKYDDWSFYRNQFGKMRDGIKAIDLLVLDPDNTAWFVEVRDYRRHPPTKAINPADVAQKLRRLLKPIDAHPVVAETDHMRGLGWRVA